MRLAIHLAFFLTIFGGPSFADEFPRLTHVETEVLEGDRTLISSRSWLRGVHLDGPRVADAPRLTAYVPKEWESGQVCARFTLISGRLISISDFSVPAGWPGERALLDLDIPEEFTPVLAKTTMNDSGVTIENRRCQDFEGEEGLVYTAGFWNNDIAPGTSPTQMILNLNIARADELIPEAYLSADPQEGRDEMEVPVTCERLDTETALSFNYRCITDLADLDVGRLRFSYKRLYLGEESDSREAIIVFGAE